MSINSLKVAACIALLASSTAVAEPHNVILFVPDGLRSQIVDANRAPAMARLKAEGVDFKNSHSLFPTFTTANASAFATGHELGDTGDYSNYIYTGVRTPAANATVSPYLENDKVLREVNGQFRGNYLHEAAVIAAARAKGYGTALIGKLGPTVIFDLGALTPDLTAAGDGTLVIDDTTGVAGDEAPLSRNWKAAFAEAKIATVAPGRGDNGNFGDATHPGTWVPNLAQEQYFLEVALKVVLPHFQSSRKPFVMVFWSRDPDGTQHNQGDSYHTLDPGINGPSSFAAIRNADNALDLIEARLKSLNLYDNTNIIVAADHGFSTIIKSGTDSRSMQGAYKDVKSGELPPGFLAIDLYEELKSASARLKLFDPDSAYKEIDWRGGAHPLRGNALVGEDAEHPDVVVVANGGSDLIYLPTEPIKWQRDAQRPHPARSASERQRDRQLAERVVRALLKHDYVSGIFVDTSRFGPLPRTLSLNDIGLAGKGLTPRPDIVVSFASKPIPGCQLGPSLCAEEVADTALIEGQGMHGSFSRADTWSFMAARGPDFRRGFPDPLPASNADIGMTIAHILGLSPASKGKLVGRVLTEALSRAVSTDVLPTVTYAVIPPEADRRDPLQTLLKTQTVDGHVYYDVAGFTGRTVGLER